LPISDDKEVLVEWEDVALASHRVGDKGGGE